MIVLLMALLLWPMKVAGLTGARIGILAHLTITASAAVDLHIGMIAQLSGSWKSYGNTMLDVEDYYRDWFARRNNKLNGVEYNVIWHHADTRSNKTYMAEIVVPFTRGEFDTQNQ